MTSGRYIVLEGQDGIGKTTQVKLLVEYFQEQGREVLSVREPGGNLPSAKILRELIKNKAYDLDALSNVLLFTANRRELWLKLIKPALKRDAIVISDRNWWSTIAFEHYGFNEPADFIQRLQADCLPERYLSPDIGIIMDMNENERSKRMSKRGNDHTKDTFESRDEDFQQRVSVGYRKIAAELNIPIIDATGTPKQVHASILQIINT